MRNSRTTAISCLAVLCALYMVGAVSHGVLRHVVQTLPLWFPIVWGFRDNELAKWAALPCLVFWLAIVGMIWLFLLGWAHLVSGHFSPTEIAMTIVIAVGSVAGLITICRWRTAIPPLPAGAAVLLFAVLQLMAFRISLLPSIAHR